MSRPSDYTEFDESEFDDVDTSEFDEILNSDDTDLDESDTDIDDCDLLDSELLDTEALLECDVEDTDVLEIDADTLSDVLSFGSPMRPRTYPSVVVAASVHSAMKKSPALASARVTASLFPRDQKIRSRAANVTPARFLKVNSPLICASPAPPTAKSPRATMPMTMPSELWT